MFFKKRENKIFCISMQRTGTTSVGDFFEYFGFKRAGWSVTLKNNWGRLSFDGDYEAIFNSKEFKNNQVFEDGPWSIGHFYKVLHHRFPNAKFILFTRDEDKWFDSMKNHSKGKTLGNTFRHCNYYFRETEYYNFISENHNYLNDKIDNLLEINEKFRDHYKQIYINRNRQVVDFFNSRKNIKNNFIHLKLEDHQKWNKLGEFFDINVPENFIMHSNKS